jgi:hypothetical protein
MDRVLRKDAGDLEHVVQAVVVRVAHREVEQESARRAEVVRMIEGVDHRDDPIVLQSDVADRAQGIEAARHLVSGDEHLRVRRAAGAGGERKLLAWRGNGALRVRAAEAALAATTRREECGSEKEGDDQTAGQ